LQLEVTALTEPEPVQLPAAPAPQFHPSSLAAVLLPGLAAREVALPVAAEEVAVQSTAVAELPA